MAESVTLNRVLARPREPLTVHTRAVVQRVDQWAQVYGAHVPEAWLFQMRMAAWLHDSGKLAQAFQRGLRDRRQRWHGRHEVLSLAFVPWLGVDPAWVLPISAAIVSHHRDWSVIRGLYPPGSTRVDDLIAELHPATVRLWYDWLHGEGVPLRPYHMPESGAIHTLLDALEDAIDLHADAGAALEWVRWRGLLLQADHAGAGGVTLAPALSTTPLDTATFVPTPYAYQQQAASVPGSVFISAPTGSGKTEAALFWIARQPVPRLFYVLPYRTSINAMQRRLEPVFGAVALWHGRALTVVYRRLLDQGRTPQDAEHEARAHQQAARLHGVAARVLSPYLLLAALYQLKGYEATLLDTWHGCVVVDEIHAYHPARLAMLVCLLRWLHTHWHTRICIMSATLPPRLARELCDVLKLTPIQADADLYRAFQRHRLHLVTGDVSDHLPSIAQQGQTQRVLVVVNTVRRARAVAQALSALGMRPMVLHSRFNARDRWQREQALIARLATGEPLIAVSTQVIEVSLDISFDVLHSDPAPLDALVQRMGRVNRRREQPLADCLIYSEPTGADQRHPIYDVGLVQATLDVLAAWDGQAVDESRISDLLGQVYDRTPDWERQYREQLDQVERWVLGALRPLESVEEALEEAFYRQIDEVLVLPLALEGEYRDLLDTAPLAADELLVPLRWGQYKMLEGQRRAWRSEDGRLFFVDAPYDPDTGLTLEDECLL